MDNSTRLDIATPLNYKNCFTLEIHKLGIKQWCELCWSYCGGFREEEEGKGRGRGGKLGGNRVLFAVSKKLVFLIPFPGSIAPPYLYISVATYGGNTLKL